MTVPAAASNPDAMFSISAAARECPDALCLRTPEGDVSFAQMAELVAKRILTLPVSQKGRPVVLTVGADLGSFVSLYACLETRTPVLPLHTKLTQAERTHIDALISAIDEPLAEGTALVMFTSGTTGRAKPVMITRKALAASALSSAANLTLARGDVWQSALSPARIGGYSILTRSLAARSAVCLAPAVFTGKGLAESIEKDGITITSVVPAMLARLMIECPEWKVPERFRAMLVGGAGLSVSLRAKAVAAGIPVMTTYGCTETASNVVTTPYKERFSVVTTGVVNAGAQVKVEDGRIYVRGPMKAAGYWGGKKFEDSEWLATGDLGSMDENGRLSVHARESDVIITAGEKVIPSEVEAALEAIEGIDSALVVGMDDAVWGKVVAAFVTGPEEISDAELVPLVIQKLARFKAPRRLAWVEHLPQTSAGKADRRPPAADAYEWHTLHYSKT